MPPTIKKHRVSVVDDHKLFTESFKLTLEWFTDIDPVGAYNSAEEFLDDYASNPSELVFMDINLGSGMDGIQATKEILKHNPAMIVVAVSMYDDGHTVQKMLKAGAKGYLTKTISIDELEIVFDKAWKGKIHIAHTAAENCAIVSTKDAEKPQFETEPTSTIYFTKKDFSESDLQIMQFSADGKTEKEISEEVHLTVKVVEYRKMLVFKKLGAKNVAEMISIAFRFKLVS